MSRGTRKGTAGAVRADSIFQRIKLRPTQLRTVAQRRFEDAECLRKTGVNARANGAMYLGGYAIECLLKAKLLEKFRWLQSVTSPEGRSQKERRVWSLCYRSHDLDEILECIPEVRRRLLHAGGTGGRRPWQSLKSVCGQWTVFARYSPRMANTRDAGDFLEKVRELRTWLA